MRLVRSKEPMAPPQAADGTPRWPRMPQLRGTPAHEVTEALFRNAASERVLQTWSRYLKEPDSASDAGIASIRSVVQVLSAVAAKRAPA